MGMGGIMGAAASGLAAQSTRLATVADNVANANTTGYKDTDTEFYSLVEQMSASSAYQASGVSTVVRHNVMQQGAIESTNSSTDMAIKGNGFFVVSDASGTQYLTRSGSFTADAQGRLVNGAGYYLMGCPEPNADAATPQTVSVDFGTLNVAATTSASIQANFPASAAAVDAADLPSTNSATASYSAKTSEVVYDNVGQAVTLDVYMTNTGSNQWEVAVYNQADATNGGFPYANAALATQNATFSAAGNLLSGGNLSVSVPNGQNVSLDLSKSTQYASPFNLQTSSQDGHAPATIDHIDLASDGTLYSVYQDGTRVPTWRVPLATVASPDLLSTVQGTAFQANNDSGPVLLDFPQNGGRGSIQTSSLEQSTVDLATELTAMIETQRAYQANSKTFQAGADILDVLVNLK